MSAPNSVVKVGNVEIGKVENVKDPVHEAMKMKK